MIWKPKEKELTLDEALALAKKELTPFWLGSPPLIAGIEWNGTFQVVPIDSEFNKKSWMIFLIDPTDFEGENAMLHAKEWHRRYALNRLGFILVLVPSYNYLRKIDAIQKLLDRQQINFPVVLDTQGELAHGFRSPRLPKILLFHQGKSVSEMDAQSEPFFEIETKVQIFLRSLDPGLALFPVYRSASSNLKNRGGLAFGYQQNASDLRSPAYPTPGFEEGADGIRRATFPKAGRPPLAAPPSTLSLKETESRSVFSIQGKWQQYAEGIATNDSEAEISFLSPSGRISVIAAPIKKVILDPPRISIEAGGNPAYEAIFGEDIRVEDSGETQIRVTKPLFYHALVGVPTPERRITLKFPHAAKNPLFLYAIRFGD
jgi:hypothetical protein